VNIGHVAGGTNAGWRKVKQAHSPWRCLCPNPEGRSSRYKINPGYRNSCPDCGNPRPS